MVFDTHCHVHLYPEHFSEQMAEIYMGELSKVPLWWNPSRNWVKENLSTDLAIWESCMPFHFIADSLVWAKRAGVLDRVLWGSDYPSCDPADSLSLYRRLPEYTQAQRLEPALAEEDVEAILGGNARWLLASMGL